MGNRAVRKWKKTRMVTAMLAVCSIFLGIIVGCQVKSNEKFHGRIKNSCFLMKLLIAFGLAIQ